ncbi:DUF3995 domain-containing protein [Natrinema soli]|uniref:DUF3995 domain-containing protein n=1 Tax=Natrinema soli TaxID=1930624 RepID=A0ABD5SIV8_9EURY
MPKSPPFTGHSSPAVWPGYAAGAWALLFTLPHVYWALGGTVGLAGRSMTGTLLLVNLVAIPLLLVAAGGALGTVQSWGQMIPCWVLLPTVWGTSVVLSVRGIGGLVQRSFSGELIRNQPLLSLFADPWFVFGGVLFGVAAWAYTRKSRDESKLKSGR